jgi:hypothetical protein
VTLDGRYPPPWHPEVRCGARMDDYFADPRVYTVCGRPVGHDDQFGHHPVPYAHDRPTVTTEEAPR